MWSVSSEKSQSYAKLRVTTTGLRGKMSLETQDSKPSPVTHLKGQESNTNTHVWQLYTCQKLQDISTTVNVARKKNTTKLTTFVCGSGPWESCRLRSGGGRVIWNGTGICKADVSECGSWHTWWPETAGGCLKCVCVCVCACTPLGTRAHAFGHAAGPTRLRAVSHGRDCAQANAKFVLCSNCSLIQQLH